MMKGLCKKSLRSFTVITLVCSGAIAAFAQTAARPAQATGPIPATKDSYPFLQAGRIQTIVDLQKLGYVEEEFIVSGTANVYDWAADGSLNVTAPNAPYTTRILIRRPANAAKFSGNVIIEPLENTRAWDWAFLWATSYEYLTEHGYAWVGVTHNPNAIDALKRFNPARYAPLSMANPTPDAVCPGQTTKSPAEAGLKFDMFSQAAALLKSASGPMPGFKVENVYLTSHTGEIVTYMNAVHPHAKLADGKPVFDGYLIKGPQGPVAISRCSAAPGPNDARRLTKNVGVPVIRVVAEGDVIAGYALRRPDSDAANDRFRQYEVAAAPHMDIRYYQHMPVIEDQTKTGTPGLSGNWSFTYNCNRPIGAGLLELPVFQTSLNAAFYHLDQWVRKGAAPPRASVMTIKDAGTPQVTIATDQYGNGIGGIRSPYVDVPTATYFTHTPGQAVCNNLGYKVPFDWTRLEQLYGNSKNYAAKVTQKIDQLVKDRWLLDSDAKRLKMELLAPPAATKSSSNNN